MMTIQNLDAAIRPFHLLRLRVTLRPEEALRLPRQAGSSIRGALAAATKDVVCVRRDLDRCEDCPHHADCAYPYLFETSAPAGAPGSRGYEQFPRPYIISHPPPRRDQDHAADHIIGLTLVGRAARFFPYLALALRDLENRGIGFGRGKFTLAAVDALDLGRGVRRLYEGENALLYNQDCPITGGHVLDHARSLLPALSPADSPFDRRPSSVQSSPSSILVNYLSPTALHYQKRTAPKPDFHILIRNLLRRISMLSLGHCDHRMNLDFGAIIGAAEQIELIRFHGRQEAWERVSRRQNQRVPMSGFYGQAVYSGDVSPFLPLLLLGSLVHVGDNAAFGMGRFIIGAESPEGMKWLPAGWEFNGERYRHDELAACGDPAASHEAGGRRASL